MEKKNNTFSLPTQGLCNFYYVKKLEGKLKCWYFFCVCVYVCMHIYWLLPTGLIRAKTNLGKILEALAIYMIKRNQCFSNKYL